jgi:hypothetical protein
VYGYIIYIYGKGLRRIIIKREREVLIYKTTRATNNPFPLKAPQQER